MDESGEGANGSNNHSKDRSQELTPSSNFKCPALPYSAIVADYNTRLEQNGNIDNSIMSIMAPKLEYEKPSWAVEPNADHGYGLEIIKCGTIIERIDLKRSNASTFVVIGRLKNCDVHMEHPTISRHHCILQYGEDHLQGTGIGWYIYDLGSTHGTKLNKHKIPPKKYVRVRVGYVMQFGGSSRLMTLIGPESDTEAECEHSPTEMRMQAKKLKLEEISMNKKAKVVDEKAKEDNECEGIMWGMSFDEEMAYAQGDEIGESNREDKYRDDPLKYLGHFFAKEGFEMEFTYDEFGIGHNHKWTCSIELPVDTAAGHSLMSSATCSGSKRDAQMACALNACRTLDVHGLLFRMTNEARKRAKNLADNDFYDSDEDTYFDRTGEIEKHREKRRQRVMNAKGESSHIEAETYEGLQKKIISSEERMSEIEKKLESLSKNNDEMPEGINEDGEGNYSKQLGQADGLKDTIEIKTKKSILRQQLISLKHEKERFEKLAKIAKPIELPVLKMISSTSKNSSTEKLPTGTLSMSTMKKLMKIRRTKAVEHEKSQPFSTAENEESKPVEAHLPTEDFIKNDIDNRPFEVEVEESDCATQSCDSPLQCSSVSTYSSNERDPPDGSKTLAKQTFNSSKIAGLSQSEVGGALNECEHLISAEKAGSTVKRRLRRTREELSTKREMAFECSEGVDDSYITWMPPEQQKGDGTTKLNEKFAGKY